MWQAYMEVELADKVKVLWSFIKTHLNNKCIVFLSSCKQVKYIYEAFRHLRPGVPLLALHGKVYPHRTLKNDPKCSLSNAYTHADTHAYAHAYTHACTHAYTHAYTHPYTHPYAHAYTQAYTHPYAHAYTQAYTHPYTHPYTRAYTCLYRYLYTCYMKTALGSAAFASPVYSRVKACACTCVTHPS